MDKESNYRYKRIDKMLEDIGVDTEHFIIVYDSIATPILYYFAILPVGGIGIMVEAISTFGLLNCTAFILITFPLYYLFWANKSYGFAISESEIYVINPNYPFQSLNKIGKTEIKSIKMGRDRNYGLSYLFFSFYNCYLEVSTDEKIHRFYCYSLEDEYYDNFEGWETKTTDGLEYQLKSKGYPIELTNNFF